MKLAQFKQDAQDRRRYIIDYSLWLDTDEILSDVTATGDVLDDGFLVDSVAIDTTYKSVEIFVRGGLPDEEYNVTILVTTSDGQIKEDWVTIEVT